MESSGAILVKKSRALPDYKACVVAKGEAKRRGQIHPSAVPHAAEAGAWMAEYRRNDFDAANSRPTGTDTGAGAASETRRGDPWTIGRLSAGWTASRRRAADGVWNP